MNTSDKELGDALLKLDLTPSVGSAGPQLERIIDGERRRIKWLTRATVGLWILAVLGAMSLYIVAGLVFPMMRLEQARKANFDQPDTPILMLAKLTAVNIIVSSLSVAILSAAGLATVLLFFYSRRATLRQINANLLQISEQVKHMRPPPQTPA